MDLTDIIKDIGSGQWLALALIIAAYLRRIVAEDSKFPINIAPAWRPVLVAFIGAVYGGLTARAHGATVGASVLFIVFAALAGGLGDKTLSAVWAKSSSAPAWARALVFVGDDLTGRSNGDTSSSGSGRGSVAAMKPPTKYLRRPLVVASTIVVAIVLVACSAMYPMLGKVEQLVLDDVVAGKTAEQIETDVGTLLDGKVGGDVAKIVQDTVALLIDGGWVPAPHMAAAQALKATEYAKVMAHERAAAPMPPAPVNLPPGILALMHMSAPAPVDAGAPDARAGH